MAANQTHNLTQVYTSPVHPISDHVTGSTRTSLTLHYTETGDQPSRSCVCSSFPKSATTLPEYRNSRKTQTHSSAAAVCALAFQNPLLPYLSTETAAQLSRSCVCSSFPKSTTNVLVQNLGPVT